MSTYVIDYSDPLRPSFTIPAGSYDGPGIASPHTSLRLFGEGAQAWGEATDENLVRLAENFAGATAPIAPIAGQLWYSQQLYWRDTTVSIPPPPPPGTTLAPASAFYRFNLSTLLWNNNPTGSFIVTVISDTISNYGPGTIATLGVITPGSGYTPGVYTSVALTGGTGHSAKATITVDIDGTVHAGGAVLTAGGIGYIAPTDSLSASLPGGTLFAVLVATTTAPTVGDYVWSITDGKLYRWDNAYKQAPLAWLPRIFTTFAGPASGYPTQVLMVYDLSGTFVPTGNVAAVSASSTIAAINTNATYYPTFVSATTGNLPINVDSDLTYNPSTNILTAVTFSGALSGNATSATNATNTGITNDTTTNAIMYPTWVTTTTGNLPQKVSSTKLSFNPSTGTLTATTFAGNLTGNASGSSGSCTGNAATATSATTAATATTAGNLTGTPTLPNGTAATTQATSDNTTKLATTAFVHSTVTSTVFTSPQQTLPVTGLWYYTVSHGLGAMPTSISISLVCITAEAGYSPGSEVIPFGYIDTVGGAYHLITLWATTSVVGVGNNFSQRISINAYGGGANVFITPANWKFILRARL